MAYIKIDENILGNLSEILQKFNPKPNKKDLFLNNFGGSTNTNKRCEKSHSFEMELSNASSRGLVEKFGAEYYN